MSEIVDQADPLGISLLMQLIPIQPFTSEAFENGSTQRLSSIAAHVFLDRPMSYFFNGPYRRRWEDKLISCVDNTSCAPRYGIATAKTSQANVGVVVIAREARASTPSPHSVCELGFPVPPPLAIPMVGNQWLVCGGEGGASNTYREDPKPRSVSVSMRSRLELLAYGIQLLPCGDLGIGLPGF